MVSGSRNGYSVDAYQSGESPWFVNQSVLNIEKQAIGHGL